MLWLGWWELCLKKKALGLNVSMQCKLAKIEVIEHAICRIDKVRA